MKTSGQEHLDKIRERFTRTAEPFAVTAQSRAREVERLAAMAMAGYTSVSAAIVLDVACGPGTFARAFAPRVARVVGLDFTPAMLMKARSIAAETQLANLEFLCGDGNALPFASGTFDLALCTYAFHHLPEPARVLHEMARVVGLGGRVAVVDVIMPAHADAALHNQIEKLRDASHAKTLGEAAFRGMFRAAGLREIASNLHDRERDFDDWMRGAGWKPGSPVYNEVRSAVEASRIGNKAGFTPRYQPDTGALTVTQTTLSLVATKD